MFRLIEILRKVVEDFGEIVLSVFGGEGDDVLKDDASCGVSPLGPHFDKFLDTYSDGFGGIFDVSIPDLVGSHPGHLQFIVLDYVHCHESPIVGVCLVVAPRVVHVTL